MSAAAFFATLVLVGLACIIGLAIYGLVCLGKEAVRSFGEEDDIPFTDKDAQAVVDGKTDVH